MRRQPFGVRPITLDAIDALYQSNRCSPTMILYGFVVGAVVAGVALGDATDDYVTDYFDENCAEWSDEFCESVVPAVFGCAWDAPSSLCAFQGRCQGPVAGIITDLLTCDDDLRNRTSCPSQCVDPVARLLIYYEVALGWPSYANFYDSPAPERLLNEFSGYAETNIRQALGSAALCLTEDEVRDPLLSAPALYACSLQITPDHADALWQANARAYKQSLATSTTTATRPPPTTTSGSLTNLTSLSTEEFAGANVSTTSGSGAATALVVSGVVLGIAAVAFALRRYKRTPRRQSHHQLIDSDAAHELGEWHQV
ncbi:Uncharacterized protein PBTT_03875 [Plasmodiophora brassicae]